MSTQKLKLERAIDINDTLAGVANVLFEIKTGFKISQMMGSAESKVKDYNKEKAKKLKGLRKEWDEVKDLKEKVEYVLVNVDGMQVPILAKDYEKVVEEIESLADTEVEIEVREFNFSEFTIDKQEEDEKGKKKTVKKNMATAAFLKVMAPFIDDVEKMDVIKT